MNILRETSTPEYWNSIYEASKPDEPYITDFERRMFQAYVKTKPGMTALDAGCGRGEFTAYLGALGLEVLGLDFAASALVEAQRNTKRQDNVTFDLHDFSADSIHRGLQPESLDVIVCRLSIAYLDRHRFLVDARRWLKPSGLLHITTHIIDRSPPALRHRGLTAEELHDLEAGWGRSTGYHLVGDGSLTCLVLREPYPSETL
ncbi:class I SAM-dependent methyltransferase [Streptomyces sp. NPDC050439]|uniref:class I SAM-dependent methyltransferase n=1 Tax=unclassified Streptomyces TaxID=2593676 RepID=UPI00342D666C